MLEPDRKKNETPPVDMRATPNDRRATLAELEEELWKLIESPDLDEWARAVLRMGLEGDFDAPLPPRPLPSADTADYFFI